MRGSKPVRAGVLVGGFAAILAAVAVATGANPTLVAAPGPCAAFAYIMVMLRPEPATDVDVGDEGDEDIAEDASNTTVLVIGCLFLVVATLALTSLDEAFSLLVLAVSVVIFGAVVCFGRR